MGLLISWIIDAALTKDRAEGRDPMAKASATMQASRTYSQLNTDVGLDYGASAHLAGIAAGVVLPGAQAVGNPWAGYWDSEGRWVE